MMLTVQQLLRVYGRTPKLQSLLKVEKKQNELGMYDVYYLLNCTRRSFQLLVGFSYREMAPPPSKRRCLKVSRKPLGTRSLFLLARFALNIAQCLYFRIQFLFQYCLIVLPEILVIWHSLSHIRNVQKSPVPSKPPIISDTQALRH